MTHQALLVGLPGSGKTTFLAALWHVIVSRDVPDALPLAAAGASMEHLNTLRGRWLSVEESHRTSSGAENVSTIRMELTSGGPATEVVVPDLAGESLQQSLSHRKWTADFSAFVRESTGVLLFVHAGEVYQHWSILDADEMADGDTQSSLETRAADDSIESEWDPSKLPTQVHLVDLLQVLCDHIAKDRFRLALVVSAWDLVDELRPSEWLARELPLLDQFVVSARPRLDFRVYGVSAQGGRLPEDADRLKAHITASHRIQVVLGDSAHSNDITAPLRWILDADRD